MTEAWEKNKDRLDPPLGILTLTLPNLILQVNLIKYEI